jgi:hypothetical protein
MAKADLPQTERLKNESTDVISCALRGVGTATRTEHREGLKKEACGHIKWIHGHCKLSAMED